MAEQIDVRPVGARTRLRRQVRRQTRRSLLHTTAAIVPGAGLLGTRYRRLGVVLLGAVAVIAVVLALFVLAKGAVSAALNVAVRPDALLTVAGLTVVGGLVWIFSIILTHIGTAPDRTDDSSPWPLRLFTAFVCLLVAMPAIQVVRYSLIQRDVVSTVFTGPSLRGLTPSAAQTATPEPQAPDPWADVKRVNLLLLGSDAGSDRMGLRTDSMVEASIDPQTGKAILFSLPRNLQRVPFPTSNPLHKYFPNGYYCPERGVGNECLLNAVWAEAESHKADFPASNTNVGLSTLRDVIGEVTGLHVDYTTVIDLEGFQKLVDAMGGVTVNVTERLPIEGYYSGNQLLGTNGWIDPGVQKLDGYHALWYARSRLTTDDFSRMRRQRCLIGALLDQVNPVTMLSQYPQLADVAKQNVSTDIPVEQLPAWVDLVQRIQKGAITSLTFTDANVSTANPNFAKIRDMVQQAINPLAATPTTTAPSTTTTSSSSKASGKTTPTRTPSPTSTTTPTVAGGVVDVREAC